MRTALGVAAAMVVALSTPLARQPAAAAPRGPEPQPAAGSYRAVEPYRALDTQHTVGAAGPGDAADPAPVPPGGSATVTVAGNRGGSGSGDAAVPASAAAVMVRVSATGVRTDGSIAIYSTGARRPDTADLYFAAGLTQRNLSVVAPGSAGRATLYNDSTGAVDLRVEVVGYYAGGGSTRATRPGAFAPVSPARMLDTRHAVGVRTSTPIRAHSSVTVRIARRHRVPAGAAEVALNISATDGSAGGEVRAYASGDDRPGTTALAYGRSAPVAGLSVVPTGDDGKVVLYNDSPGTVHLLADVQGYFAAGSPYVAGDFAAVPPARVADRVVVGAGDSFTAPLAGRAGIPRANVAAASVSVTVARAARSGDLRVGDAAGARPATADLATSTTRAVTNLAVVRTSGGAATVYNESAVPVRVSLDVTGYVAAADLPVPPTATSHYVRKLSNQPGGFTDQSASGVGCQDARSGDEFVLLDIGGQFRDRPAATPYVKLSATDIDVGYPRLVAAVDSYVAGYVACDQSPHLTLAVGTNNDGDLERYSAARMGADWANLVVDAINPVGGVTVRGANDIEAGFTGDQYQALRWTRAFLAATDKDLVFNGSADDCPTGYSARARSDTRAGDCAYGWTQAQYRQLTHSGEASTTTPGADRIQALPQIYTPAQARQWTNIARDAGGVIEFAGSLTEHASGPCDLCGMIAPQGWTMLYRRLSTVDVSPNLPVAADLDIID